MVAAPFRAMREVGDEGLLADAWAGPAAAAGERAGWRAWPTTRKRVRAGRGGRREQQWLLGHGLGCACWLAGRCGRLLLLLRGRGQAKGGHGRL